MIEAERPHSANMEQRAHATAIAARSHIPAVYGFREFVTEGGFDVVCIELVRAPCYGSKLFALPDEVIETNGGEYRQVRHTFACGPGAIAEVHGSAAPAARPRRRGDRVKRREFITLLSIRGGLDRSPRLRPLQPLASARLTQAASSDYRGSHTRPGAA